jgi:hypothetical protein
VLDVIYEIAQAKAGGQLFRASSGDFQGTADPANAKKRCTCMSGHFILSLGLYIHLPSKLGSSRNRTRTEQVRSMPRRMQIFRKYDILPKADRTMPADHLNWAFANKMPAWHNCSCMCRILRVGSEDHVLFHVPRTSRLHVPLVDQSASPTASDVARYLGDLALDNVFFAFGGLK